MPSIATFLINLDRSPERLAAIAARLQAVGIEFTRIAAVDGEKLGEKPWPDTDEAGWRNRFGKGFLPNAVGCYLSHYKALSEFLEAGYEYGLILEDDIEPSAELPAVLDALVTGPQDWDVVRLSAHAEASAVVPARPLLANGSRLVFMLAREGGTGAYLVNRFAASRYVERMLPVQWPYDWAFDRAWHFGFRFRAVQPWPVKAQTMGRSTITYQKHQVRHRKTLLQRILNRYYRAVERRALSRHYRTTDPADHG